MSDNLFSKNFSNTCVLTGETTTFLRIIKEDEQTEYKMYIIPEVLEGNKEDIYINGMNLNDFVWNKTEETEDYYNIFGAPQNVALLPDASPPVTNPYLTIDKYNFIDSDIINKKEITIKVDYTGQSNCQVRLNILFAKGNNDLYEIIPNENDLEYQGEENGKYIWEYKGQELEINQPFPTLDDFNNNGWFINEPDSPIPEDDLLVLIQTFLICNTNEKTQADRDLNEFIHKPLLDNNVSDKSFMLLKTNPKISGNIKLVVDSTEKLFLESLDANPELSKEKYKKRPVTQNSSYPLDIYRYFGQLTPEILYDVYHKNSDYKSTKLHLYNQYDNFYSYGTQQLDSKFYDEELSIFAPLWLKKRKPEFFVVFKTPGPLNLESYNQNDYHTILKDALKESEIIKTFDLRDGSNLGNYLNKITNDERFSEQPLRINFDENELSIWSGVHYKEGVITERGEYLKDFISQDNAINVFEERITNGFERNNIISTNLINLEFLFTDHTSELYEINRYFGIYVDFSEIFEFELNQEKFLELDNQLPIPLLERDLKDFSNTSFIQENEKGIKLPFKNEDFNIPKNECLIPERVFSVLDKNNQLHRIKEIDNNFITLYNKNEDISNFLGNTNIKTQLDARPIEPGRNQFKFSINEETILQGERFVLEEPISKKQWICIANNHKLKPGEAWQFPIFDKDINAYINTFSVEGNKEDIAEALKNCINSFELTKFTAFKKNNTIWIQNNSENEFSFIRKFELTSSITNIDYFGKTPIINQKHNLIDKINTESTILLEYPDEEIISNYQLNLVSIHEGLTPESPPEIVYIGKFQLYQNNTLIRTFYRKIEQDFSVQIGNLKITYKYSEDNKIVDYLYDSPTIEFPLETDISWIWESDTSILKLPFIGSADKFGNKIRIKQEDLENIDIDSWFQFQKNNFSRLRSWDFTGHDIFIMDYLETPIYNEDNEIMDYRGLDDFAIIQLDENEPFKISVEGKTTAFKSYFSKLGLCSISDIRIFDTDWLTSDYSKTPITELFGFFDEIELQPGEEFELEENESYKITNEGNGQLIGYKDNQKQELLDEEDLLGKNDYFNSYILPYKFTQDNLDEENSNLSTYKYEKKFDKIIIRNDDEENPLKFVRNLYTDDANMRQFIGFSGINDFMDVNDELEFAKLQRQNDVNRFFIGQLKSEYDRLRENYNKEFAVKSKVVPTILKWVSKFKDCRDNPIRLNNSMAFGINNFSPDPDIITRDPAVLTHEFFYVDAIPKNFDPDFIENSKGLFFNNITEEKFDINGEKKSWYDLFKLDSDIDYFTKYFTVGTPTEKYNDKEINLKTEKRYVRTEFVEGIDKVQCIFRGAKFNVEELNEDGEIVDGSRKYEGYKFSVLLRFLPISVKDFVETTDEEFIINDKHKTILYLKTIYLNDFRVNSLKYGYSTPYFLNSLFRLRSFNSDFPGVKSQILKEYGDIKLDNYIPKTDTEDISILEFNNETRNIGLLDYGIYDLDENKSEDAEINDNVKITSIGNNKYSTLSHYYKFSQIRYIENFVIDLFDDDPGYPEIKRYKINFKRIPYNFIRSTSTKYNFTFLMTHDYRKPILEENDYKLDLWYLDGGKNYLKRIMRDLSFAKTKDKLRSDKILMQYKHPTKIEKINKFIPTEDIDKPDYYSNIDIIGFDLEETNENEILFRYKDKFEPKTKSIMNYYMREDKNISNLFDKDVINSNFTLNLSINDSGIIKNKFINKVGRTNLSRLGEKSEYESVYPFINEINIDTIDYRIFAGKWDNNYYSKWTNLENKKLISGLNELQNFKSFFGSKAMKLPLSFNINKLNEDEFTFEIHESIKNNIKKGEDTTSKIKIQLFIDKIITRYLIDEGATKQFEDLNEKGIFEKVFGHKLNDDEILEIIKKYIELNIIELFKVENISLWSKDSDEIKFENELSKIDKVKQGYKQIDSKINSITDYKYLVTNLVNIDKLKSFSVNLRIKRI